MADVIANNNITKKKRTPTNGFKKGQSGNPSGRPKVPQEIKDMFKAAAPDAVQMLIALCNNECAKDADRIKAAEIILDRHLGKAIQAVDMDMKSVPQVIIKGADDVLD